MKVKEAFNKCYNINWESNSLGYITNIKNFLSVLKLHKLLYIEEIKIKKYTSDFTEVNTEELDVVSFNHYIEIQ